VLRLGKKVLIIDGGFGSELERIGLTGIPEDYNLTRPDAVVSVHRAYACADIVTTNTFGLNRIKYRGEYDLKTLAEAAIRHARAAGKKVFFDVGPTGALLAPLGTLSFDEAYNAYAEIAELTRDLVDGYICETFSDLYEMKACLLAIKERTSLPVFATMTFDASERTLTGSTPEIVANTLEGLGADALGVNCSGGAGELHRVVTRMLAVSGVPVIVQPNRGMPLLKDGKTVYGGTAEQFEAEIERFLEAGASAVGGCCGTTPEFIERIAKFRGRDVVRRTPRRDTAVNSATVMTVIDGVKICGERLNPTGKKKLKEALLAGDYDYLIDEAIRQQEAGADLLDLNVGVPKTDEPAAMERAVKRIQEYCDLPLQIDSSDAEAVERGARYYNGIPLINSVNGEDEVMDRIFPIAKKYGAVVLGLTMDANGVPKTAMERFAIAKRIVSRAEAYGIPRHKIMIDTLVLTASAEQKLVFETAEALRLVGTLGVKTALGVSNVSFGLPNRPLLNKTFLVLAMSCGLNVPIMNPLDGEMTGAVKAFGVLSGSDENAERYIAAYKDFAGTASVAAAPAKTEAVQAASLYDCVKRGLRAQAEALCRAELETRPPLEIVNGILIPALEEVGKAYDAGTLFLPQLVSAAEAAKAAFALVSRTLPKGGANRGRVVLATVRGDVHDIGKNIVKVVLESYGYEAIDLGKDVPPASVVRAYREHAPFAIGLSALMTTTVPAIEETIKALRAEGCSAKIFVGGAVLNEETAREIGADEYTADALGFVKRLEEIR
jgi:5-methyltetrahydrofolate--homocysteine methyltransferase